MALEDDTLLSFKFQFVNMKYIWILVTLICLCSNVSGENQCPDECHSLYSHAYCNNANLSGIPVCINATKMDIRYNNIAEIESEIFRRLPFLKRLDISNNMINELRGNTFAEADRLQTVILQNNRIRQVNREAFRGSSVKRVFLGSNFISSLEEGTFQYIPNVTTISLKSNTLKSLSHLLFHGLSKLKQLYISGNLLTNLPEDVFNDLHSLTDLDLSENKITHLKENTFNSLVNLKLIDLSGNGLLNTGGLFLLQAIKIVDLRDNNLARIDGLTSKVLFKLETLLISGNRWVCDQELDGLISNLTKSNSLDTDGSLCGFDWSGLPKWDLTLFKPLTSLQSDRSWLFMLIPLLLFAGFIFVLFYHHRDLIQARIV